MKLSRLSQKPLNSSIKIILKPLFILSFFVFTQTLSAQECDGYFAFEPDTKVEMTHYDKKGKVSAVAQTTITDISETDGVVEAEVTAVILDKKGEEVNNTDYTIVCSGDGYEVDISNMVNPALMKGTYGMEASVSGDALDFPKDLSVGKKLKDGDCEIEVRSNDIKIMTMKFSISNRKVIAQESITTPAGTFDCYKLTYDFNTKLAFVKKKYKITQWITDGIGVVKEETRNKKGKIESSSELTSLEKP